MLNSKLGRLPLAIGLVAGLAIALAGQANAMHWHSPSEPVTQEPERGHPTPSIPNKVDVYR